MSGGGSVAETSRLVGGRYELEALIGKGGIGEVWRARHLALNSRVAIKFLQLASVDKVSAQRRFTVEAQVTAQLKTPNAVQVFDFGITEEGQPYLVMELLEGETLGRRLERVKRLEIGETAILLGQAARALQHAHQLGIVHRDFKPDNIVIVVDDEGREQIKVLDFGIAKLVGTLEEDVIPDSTVPDARLPSFTKTGTVLGTPLYMAPEQIRNASEVDLRVDIWAFGVVAFECLTGRPPFLGTSLVELFERIDSGLHTSAAFLDPRIPAAFDAWFDIACAPDPSKRFSNASVAWKQLIVALDVASGQSLSFSGGFNPSSASGERHKSSDVLERSHDGKEFKSLQRIPMRRVLPPVGRSDVPSSSPMASSLADKTLDDPGRSRRSWVLGVAAAAVVASLFVWRVLTRPPNAPTPADSSSPAAASEPSRSQTPASVHSCRLEVTSTPNDVGVYGDGVLLGRTPLVTSVETGSTPLHLELRAAGYEPYMREFEATHDLELVAVLTPAQPSSSRAHGSSPQPPTKATSAAGAPSPSLTPMPPGPIPVPPVATAAATPPPPSPDPLGERQ